VHPTLDAFDRRVDEALDTVRGPALDAVMYRVSSVADHSLLWFTIGALRAARTEDVGFAVRFAAAMALESGLTNGPVKSLFRRTRPVHEIAEGPLPYGMRRPVTSSFPSGHATAAFAAAVLLADRHRLPWFGLATVVAGSRVYVRMHHASDVLGGAAFGLALGGVLRRWVRG
jgi:undecaprenyl-diphosphatase